MKRIDNTPNLDRIIKELNYLEKHGVIIGIFGEKGEAENDGVKVIDYAIWLITGTQFMPARDYMAHKIKSKAGRLEIVRLQKSLLSKVVKGQLTGEQALNQIGLRGVQMIKESITSNDFAPLKPETIKRKTRNKMNILRQTDMMLDAVGFEIVKL
nr:MAG TPA: virion morphogenesis protein [Caudoviricetes sp.]